MTKCLHLLAKVSSKMQAARALALPPLALARLARRTAAPSLLLLSYQLRVAPFPPSLSPVCLFVSLREGVSKNAAFTPHSVLSIQRGKTYVVSSTKSLTATTTTKPVTNTMAVKINSSKYSSPTTNTQRTAKRVLKKYSIAKTNDSADSYWRLKKIVPTISKKENISKLDVVLEAISYIQHLQGNLEVALITAAAAASAAAVTVSSTSTAANSSRQC